MKKRYMLFLLPLVLASCADDNVTTPEFPEWPTPSVPVIENAQLRGVNGETVVAAGGKVKFTANVSDEHNDLTGYRLTVAMDGAEILNISRELTGRTAVIEEEAELPFVAGFRNGSPDVTITAINALGGLETTLKLDAGASVSVTRPATPDRLYLVDNLGHVYEMKRTATGADDFGFVTTAEDLDGIGSTFKIAEKTDGNKPDYSAFVWGYTDGKISIVTSEAEPSIPVPDSDGHIIETITFDILSFGTDKTVAYTIHIDKADFFDIGGGYAEYDVDLVKGAKMKFIGFGSDVAGMLRPEFFREINGDKAVFDGPSVKYMLKYSNNNGFLYLERDRETFYPDAMYIVGTGAGLPLAPYAALLAWDFSYPHQWIFLKKTGDCEFESPLYFDNTMGFKFYRGYGWAQEENTKDDYTVEPANLVKRNPQGDLIPGPDFTPGIYTLYVNRDKKLIRMTPYRK